MHDVAGKTLIVLLSGGLDSMVCAGLAREAGARIVALTIDYNQRHRVELESAARIAATVGAVEHIVLPLDLRRFGGSALTADIDVPKDGVGSDVPVTYVPARNLIFLSLTLGLAEARVRGTSLSGSMRSTIRAIPIAAPISSPGSKT